MAKHSDCIYGTFHGGDPRNFSPDPECSTDEEQAAHKTACETWQIAEEEAVKAGKVFVGKLDPDCTIMAGLVITRCGFGLGVNSYEWDCDDEPGGSAQCWECHPELIPPFDEEIAEWVKAATPEDDSDAQP